LEELLLGHVEYGHSATKHNVRQ